MSRMKAMKTDEELLAVPVTQPVLVELPSGFDTAVDDGGEKDKGTDTKVDQDDGSKRIQDDYEALKAKSAQDAARADRAERDAAEARRLAAQREQEATEARTRSQSLEGDLITGGLSAAQAELAAAEAELERAGEAGDYKAMAKAQTRIGRASAQIVNLESGAAEIAERKETQPEPRRTQEVPTDFATRVNSNPNLLQSEKEWMIKNEAAFKDADFNKKLEFAYQGAVAKGDLVRGSPAYFDFMERATGLKTDQRSDNQDDDNERDTSVSAPPSRNERGSDGRPTNGKIMLSPEQREIARSMGVSDIEYARQVAAFDVARKADPAKYGDR